MGWPLAEQINSKLSFSFLIISHKAHNNGCQVPLYTSSPLCQWEVPAVHHGSRQTNAGTSTQRACLTREKLNALRTKHETSATRRWVKVTIQINTKIDFYAPDTHTHVWNNSRSSTAGAFWLAVAPCLLHFGPLYVLDVRLNHLMARKKEKMWEKRAKKLTSLRSSMRDIWIGD